jgi:hypothetical protein
MFTDGESIQDGGDSEMEWFTVNGCGLALEVCTNFDDEVAECEVCLTGL